MLNKPTSEFLSSVIRQELEVLALFSVLLWEKKYCIYEDSSEKVERESSVASGWNYTDNAGEVFAPVLQKKLLVFVKENMITSE